jgi:hypothetical protein
MKKAVIIILVCIVKFSFSQDTTFEIISSDTSLEINDTLKKPFLETLWSHNPHQPWRAGAYAAILPGLGQAYNQKYWKIPIVYASLAVSGFFIYYNGNWYSDLKNAYIYRTDGDSLTIDTQYADYLTDDAVLSAADQVKNWMDISIIITSAIYLLNIIDAVVDAHLYGFDVSDDLTLNISPYINHNFFYNSPTPSFGINLKLQLK